jgi:hypothetical protein
MVIHDGIHPSIMNRNQAISVSFRVRNTGPVQYHFVLEETVLIWERAYYLEEEDAVDAWFLNMYRTSRQNVVGSPGFKSWLKVNADLLSDSFRETIEAEIEKSSSYRALGTDIGLEGKSN